MKIGVIGSGEVAKTLESGFLKHGHEVMLGTRDPAKLAGLCCIAPMIAPTITYLRMP